MCKKKKNENFSHRVLLCMVSIYLAIMKKKKIFLIFSLFVFCFVFIHKKKTLCMVPLLFYFFKKVNKIILKKYNTSFFFVFFSKKKS